MGWNYSQISAGDRDLPDRDPLVGIAGRLQPRGGAAEAPGPACGAPHNAFPVPRDHGLRLRVSPRPVSRGRIDLDHTGAACIGCGSTLDRAYPHDSRGMRSGDLISPRETGVRRRVRRRSHGRTRARTRATGRACSRSMDLGVKHHRPIVLADLATRDRRRVPMALSARADPLRRLPIGMNTIRHPKRTYALSALSVQRTAPSDIRGALLRVLRPSRCRVAADEPMDDLGRAPRLGGSRWTGYIGPKR